jgi:hypothetical protein
MNSDRRSALKVLLAVLLVTGATLALTGAAQAAPANDNIANAQAIPTAGGTVNGTNVGATAESGEPRGQDFLGRTASTVWYVWTSPAQPAELTIDGCQGASYHMKLGVYKKTADPVPPFSNLEDHGAVGEDPTNSDGCSTEYGAAGLITPEACSTYYIQISGFAATEPPNGDRGPFTLSLSGGGSGACGSAPPAAPPAATPPKKKKQSCKGGKKSTASAAKKKKKKSCKK